MADLVVQESYHLHDADAFVLNELVIADSYHEHVPDTLGFYFFTDFSEYTTGNALSDWTERWSTAGISNTVQAATWDHALGKRLLLDNDTLSRKLLSWDDLDAYDTEDIDILCLFNPKSVASNPFRLYLRASGTATNETAYVLQGASSNLMLFRYVSGSSSNIAIPSSAYFADNNYWFRFRANGSSLKVKTWSYNTPEPVDWHIEETDTNVTGSGWAGFGALDAGDAYIYYFAATLGGTASPEIPESYTGISKFGSLRPMGSTVNALLVATRIEGGIFSTDKPSYVVGANIYCHNAHTSQIRMAVYSGGDLSTGPDGAELLVDLGETTGSDTACDVTLSCSPVLIPQGEPLWLAIKGDDSGFSFIYDASPSQCGNFQIAEGRFNSSVVSTDETVSYPATWPTDVGGSFLAFWYAMGILISDAAATELVIAGDHLEHYADDFTLNELVIADCYHLHEVDPDPISLTGTFDLVIPDDHLDLVTDPVSLTQEHELAVALDNFHLHDADLSDLGLTLAVPDCFHLHDADNILLPEFYTLWGLDAFHDIYNDDPILEFDAVNVSWGDQRTGSGGIIFQSHTHYCGNNVLWPGCKIKVNRYYIHIAGSHDIQRRLAVYQGGDSIDNKAGASEADLIADFGLTSGSDIDQWIYVDAPSDTYLNNSHECVWLVTKADDQSTHITIRTDLQGSQYDYDFGLIGTYGTTAKVSDDTGTPPLDAEENVAFPSAFPELPDLPTDPGVHSYGGYSLCMYLTFTVTSNTNLQVKPGVSEIFDDPLGEFVQIEYMAVHDAFHLHEADPLTLTQLHDLAVNESYHLLVDDPFPLTMNLLVALENDHLHFADQANVVPITPVLAADCHHENIPDPIDLVQLHILTVVECYHAHAGPNIALTQEHNLAIADNHLFHAAQTSDLTEVLSLEIQESYHDHVPDACDPVKVVNLLVAQGWFEHYADTVGLIVYLDISETYHEHYSDALILSLHLVVPDSNHEIHTDPLPLAQDHSLYVLGAFHEHYADQADLTEIATLVVNPCFHLHEAEPLAFCLHLIVQEAYHEHYADQATLLVLLILAGSYHLLDSDSLIIEQLHYLEIAGAGHNTSTNYHALTSDNMDWGYLLPDLGHLSLVITTTDRTLEPRTPLLSLKWIQDQRDIENVTAYRTLRKAA